MDKLREILELVNERFPKSGLSKDEIKKYEDSIIVAKSLELMISFPNNDFFQLTDKGYSILWQMRSNEILDKTSTSMDNLLNSTKKLDRATWILVAFTCALLITSVLTICATAWVFNTEREIERKSLITDMESLSIEIDKNIKIIDILSEYIKNETKLFQYVYLINNIEKTISDGRIRNETIKNRTMVRYHDLKQLGKILEITNSPDFALLNISDYPERKTGYENISITALVNQVKPDLILDKKIIRNYIYCLNSTTFIENC